MIIVNEECDYIIKNIKAVEALFESYSQVKDRVPSWVRNEVFRRLGRRIKEIPLYGEIKWDISEDEEEISITPTNYYDDDYDVGIYYGIEGFNWDALIAKDRDDGLWIYLYYSLPERIPKNMKQKIEKWEEKLLAITDKRKPALLEKYHVFPNDEDKQYLVAYYLNDILNAETLGTDPEGAINNTIDLLIQLIENTQDFIISAP